jgi:hypothetical protein|tara:strand:- start:63 stop:278 length:216 start_codon:yes stop_codon:yes gene_type:complete
MSNYGWAVIDGETAIELFNTCHIIRTLSNKKLIYCEIKPPVISASTGIQLYPEKYIPVKRSEMATIKAEDL